MKTHDLSSASKLLNISTATMQALADSGAVPGAKIGQCWVFDEEDLSAYLREAVRKQTEERRAHPLGVPRQRVPTAYSEVKERQGKRRTPPPLPQMPATA